MAPTELCLELSGQLLTVPCAISRLRRDLFTKVSTTGSLLREEAALLPALLKLFISRYPLPPLHKVSLCPTAMCSLNS